MKTNKVIKEIIRNLEEGINPWRKPWINKNSVPLNLSTGKQYNGGNEFSLMFASFMLGLPNSYWGTFEQIKKFGFHVKKGAEGFPLFYYDIREKNLYINDVSSISDWTSEEIKKGFKVVTQYILNRFYVYHFTDTNMKLEDLKGNFDIKTRENKKVYDVENIVNNFNGPEIFHSDSIPNHNEKNDRITIPEMKYMESSEEYYSTLFHELIHSTGVKKRLNRKCYADYEKDRNTKAKEELIAEVGCAILCDLAGIKNKTIQNSADYIRGWLKGFKEDPAYLFKIGSQAQKAVKLIMAKSSEVNIKKTA